MLTAAGARLDLAHPDPIMVRRQDWQTAAWGYRDVVPEMRFAMDFVADNMSRLRIFAAENRPKGEDPIPLDTEGSSVSPRTRALAKDAVDRIDLDKHGSTIMGRGGENIDTAGECYLLGRITADGSEDWSIRSVTEVRVQSNQIALVEPGRSSGGEILDPDRSELIRLWKPHPQYYDWPDAGMAASLEYAEELKLYSRLIRTSVRSRLSSGALFYLPHEFSLTRPGGAPTSATPVPGDADEDADLFMDEFVTGLVTPISDESDPSAVVPMVIRGPAMIDQKPAKDLMGAVELPRQDPEKLADQREKATRAFARGIKLPPEILMGLGDTNHWSGWVIDATTCKNYIEPRAEVMCDSLTSGYLRPFLRAAGCPEDEVRRVVLWYDPRELVENPNRAGDAKDGHTAGVISDEAYARALGFGTEDMPTLPEKVARALSGRAISDQQVPLILAALGVPHTDPLMMAAVAAARAGVAQKAPTGSGPRVIDAAPDEPPAGQDNPVPSNPLPQTASGAREPVRMLKVDERLCRALGDVDRQLTERLLAHCEATVGRAVEKAATRIKARAQRDPELAGAFRGQDQVAVVARYGRARLGEFAADDDVTDAIDQLRPRFVQAIADGAEMVADTVGQLLGRAPSRELEQKLTAGGDRAWPWLVQRLVELADQVLFEDKVPTVKGEKNPGAVPVSLVRGALTIAGGLPAGSEGVNDDGLIRSASGARPLSGLASGEAVTEEMHDGGGVELGFEWNYYGVPRAPFHPHQELSGVRFMGFDDEKLEARPQDLGWIGSHYVAGDHKGCLCSNLAIWAVPRDPMEARNLADIAMTVESPRYRQDRELLLEGPDGDDANPGRGTLPDGRTHAQAARDLREELVALRTRHILDREVQ